jgi:hypothetical protein
MNPIDTLKPQIDQLIIDSKSAINEVKKVAIFQAWKLLQIAVAHVIRAIESVHPDLEGKDKKAIAMELLSKFYDGVFIIIDIPFVPSVLEPILHKYTKAFLMILVSASIDAMVSTFREIGIFEDRS